MEFFGHSEGIFRGLSGPADKVLAMTENQPQQPHHPEKPHPPIAHEPVDHGKTPNEQGRNLVTPPTEQLAQTGSSDTLGAALPIGAGLVLAGTVLYRRARVSS